MKEVINSYFLLELDFEITVEKVEKNAFENFIFEGCVEKHTLPVLKGLRPGEGLSTFLIGLIHIQIPCRNF